MSSTEITISSLRQAAIDRLLPDHPHIDGRKPLSLGAQDDRVEFQIGEMLTIGREDLRQAYHRSDQRRGVARWLSTHPLENFVAFKLFEHRPCFTLRHRQQPNGNVFQNLDENTAEPYDQKRSVLRIGAGAQYDFRSLYHFLQEQFRGAF